MSLCHVCHRPWCLAYGDAPQATRQPPSRPAPAHVPGTAPAILDHGYRALLAALPLVPSSLKAYERRGQNKKSPEMCRLWRAKKSQGFDVGS
jgi:hypothetical protein